MAAGYGVASHQLRRRWTGIGAVLVVTVLTAGLLAIIAFRMKAHEAVLNRQGRETTAVVTASADRYKQRDWADVRYEVEGRSYETRLPVTDNDDFQVGAEIQVVYASSHRSTRVAALSHWCRPEVRRARATLDYVAARRYLAKKPSSE